MAEMVMEVDHFDPRLKDKARQPYLNLVIAYRACNNSKRAYWPTTAQERLGVGYLNPRQDVDYGEHIFEDPDTHKVWGCTPAGKWHVEKLNLNDEFLVKARAQRSRWFALLEQDTDSILAISPGNESKALSSLHEIKQLCETAIPVLPLRKNPEPDLDELEAMLTRSGPQA